LWDGRAVVQFGEAAENPADDLLVQFLINGSVAQTPYGLNGFGSGRMPAFGASLSAADIELLAHYLRAGNLDGKEGVSVLP
jgi:mono/diheme cytochrome c family protein